NHPCLVTTRSEADDTGPAVRPRGDVETAVRDMIESMDVGAQLNLHFHGLFGEDPRRTAEERLARVVQGVLDLAPDQRQVMVEHYPDIMRAVWPPGTFRGSSYSVMDIGYRRWGPRPQPRCV